VQYRRLGRTELRVSEIGHGLWGMGDWSGSSDARSGEALEASLAAGCNFFDSAAAYGEGRSDALLGALVEKHRSAGIVTAGKIPPKNLRWPASSDDAFDDVFPLEHVLSHAEQSRDRMRVPSVDLMQLHVWHDAWSDDPQFHRVAAAIKERGLARFFGISLNRWEPWNGIKAIRTGLIDAVQLIYNVFDQAPEDELFVACAEYGVGVIARVPLDEGSLSGRMSLETRFPTGDWRAQYFGPENLAPTIQRVEELKAVVPVGMSLPELALRFILQNPIVSTLVVGMRSPQHVAQNAAVSDGIRLDAGVMIQLRKHRWDRIPTPWSD
jgi:aryl-alcohol dehydrogenase-like predicted oxidoreductase